MFCRAMGETGSYMISYDADLRERLATNISAHERRTHPLDGRRAAAVAIVVVDSVADVSADPFDVGVNANSIVPGDSTGFDDRMSNVAGGAAFLLCRRAARMSSHSAQWALPGGRIDTGESAVDAARREVAEEVGLHLGAESVLGVLDDFPTRSGYVITPVVLWAGADVEIDNNPTEVAHTYRVGLAQLQRADSPRYVAIPESERPVVQIPLGKALVHAPTGAVLLQFRWVALEGQADTRVDHLEQPVFAWK
jgi:8-oxo-dGTP pyrophosphatase MutT (NUDIX family)